MTTPGRRLYKEVRSPSAIHIVQRTSGIATENFKTWPALPALLRTLMALKRVIGGAAQCPMFS